MRFRGFSFPAISRRHYLAAGVLGLDPCKLSSSPSSVSYLVPLVYGFHSREIIWGWAPHGELFSVFSLTVAFCNGLFLLKKEISLIRGDSAIYVRV